VYEFTLQQTHPSRIHRQGYVHLSHLGEKRSLPIQPAQEKRNWQVFSNKNFNRFD
jgi:hypothetical protein